MKIQEVIFIQIFLVTETSFNNYVDKIIKVTNREIIMTSLLSSKTLMVFGTIHKLRPHDFFENFAFLLPLSAVFRFL